jgi:hypothetical protein
MPLTIDGPVGPDTFTRDGHTVAIAEDGKIQVKKDDWLSKYSWALYGNYDTLDVFVRPNPALTSASQPIGGIKQIEDVDLIKTGEYLIHEPTYFYWAEKRGKQPYPRPRRRPNYPKPGPGAPPGNQLDPSRVTQFFEFLHRWLCPVTDWDIQGSTGVDLSVSLFAGSGCDISAQRDGDPQPTVFRAVSAGVGIGPEDIGASISYSPPDFWSEGFIGKFVWAGRTLSVDEISGGFMLIDFSFGFPIGWSMGLMLFGYKNPFHPLQTLWRYFRGTSDSLSFVPMCKGALFRYGLNATTPNLGVSGKLGYMYQK